ncbi:nucleoside 2-deoxyribosyltransferase [Sunxiuqinia elliptica]|uniref:Nucleoside 2-deoxyribosyltransferase n=1 Tax=Sunxiuqinia elliptica TaxID=655355 RepID=A0A1I2HLM7_9BACT|nr:nucleoside 2-deoxyribosyltransferase [Sunxiuqinia elliptica]SFF30428.1 Nucleoside 2-deoxyribosyltransferase [Sunxiuqinia elliptica]
MNHNNMKCPITELDAERVDGNSYRLELNDDYLFVRLGFTFNMLSNQEKFKKNRYLLAGAILNKQLADESENDIYWFTLTSDSFDEKLSRIEYPKTPKAKLDNLLKTLFEFQNVEGELIQINGVVSKPEFYYKHFFRSASECFYYFKELKYQELIDCVFNDATNEPFKFRITFKGLNYYLELTERGDLSNRCFVAMSFDKNMKETRDAIKLAIEKNDFEPIIIDEQIIESSQTINDAIIAAIKSCKFCIADFTQQKDGVYFESGFAVGLGKPVIYSCRNDWFKRSHFDTNHFPHVIYESTTELTALLDKKIKAWIK